MASDGLTWVIRATALVRLVINKTNTIQCLVLSKYLQRETTEKLLVTAQNGINIPSQWSVVVVSGVGYK